MYTLRKSLGQHFLKDENICRKILAVLEKESFTQLLEVGPGGGALTRYLYRLKDVNLRAVELDKEKVDYLLKTYTGLEGKILHQDFLEMDKPFTGPFVIIGNFPYNISTQILFKMLEWKQDVQCVIGMFQKEVGLRIAASEGSKVYGVTSVLIQAFFDVEYLFDVPAKCFVPPPRVTSGVLRLLPAKDTPPMKDEKAFFLLVKTAFNQRRKTLRNAVKALFDNEVIADPVFDQRAEQLSVRQFAGLTFRMKENPRK